MPDNRIYPNNRIENADTIPLNQQSTRSRLSHRERNLVFTPGGNSTLAENIAQFQAITRQEAYQRGELTCPPIPGTEQDSFVINPPLIPSQQDIPHSAQTLGNFHNSDQQPLTQEVRATHIDTPTGRIPWQRPELVELVDAVNSLKKREKLTGKQARRLKKNRLSPDEWEQVQEICKDKGIPQRSTSKAYSYLYDYSRSQKQKRINTVIKKGLFDEQGNPDMKSYNDEQSQRAAAHNGFFDERGNPDVKSFFIARNRRKEEEMGYFRQKSSPEVQKPLPGQVIPEANMQTEASLPTIEPTRIESNTFQEQTIVQSNELISQQQDSLHPIQPLQKHIDNQDTQIENFLEKNEAIGYLLNRTEIDYLLDDFTINTTQPTEDQFRSA